jgi:hypothetical protein
VAFLYGSAKKVESRYSTSLTEPIQPLNHDKTRKPARIRTTPWEWGFSKRTINEIPPDVLGLDLALPCAAKRYALEVVELFLGLGANPELQHPR